MAGTPVRTGTTIATAKEAEGMGGAGLRIRIEAVDLEVQLKKGGEGKELELLIM